MTLKLDTTHYQEQFAKAKNQANVPEFLRASQADAFNKLLLQGLPDMRVEAWKYTNLTSLAEKMWLLSEKAPAISAEFSVPEQESTLVFIDGYFCPHLSSLTSGNEIEIAPLKSIAPSLATLSDDVIDDINRAFFTDGLYLHIKSNAVIKDPIHLYHFNQTKNSMHHVRHHIVADRSSQAIIIEHHLGVADIEYFTTAVTFLHCKENANLQHYKLQQESQKAYHLSNVVTQLDTNSTLQQFKFDNGSRLARTNNTAQLLAAGAHCQLSGLYVTKGQQHIDNHTLILHQAPNTTSDELYQGILHDRSRAVFRGRVIVQQDAQKISATQTNKNLLLSKFVEIDTQPQLEIYADDVKCSHGATVGQLDEEALFYLQSRGISKEEATNALVFGFAKAVLRTIEHIPTRLYLEKLALPPLSHISHLEDLL